MLISLRAPARDRVRDGRIHATARGGLAAALGSICEQKDSAFLSIDDLPGASGHRVSFDGIANRVLWPILHGMPTRASLQGNDFQSWDDATHAFAGLVSKNGGLDSTIWVHDYQLSLLPGRIRSLAPHARIGWFCHVPWPSSDTLAVLPYRDRVLDGILGSSYIGFHTDLYSDNFLACVRDLTSHRVDFRKRLIEINGRSVHVGVHAVGVPFDNFDRCGRDPEVMRAAAKLRAQIGGDKIIASVDRLDYTKGLLERLHALEKLFSERPEFRGKISFVQVAAPTRISVPGYAELRHEIEAVVSKINGRYSEGGWLPVRYWARSLSGADLVALYMAADIMAVTPLRDGMNLVAQEFVASRHDEDGVLVLSELAGAASYLHGAVSVNPWWIEDMTSGLVRALEMPREERRRRMRALRDETRGIDIAEWIPNFVRELER